MYFRGCSSFLRTISKNVSFLRLSNTRNLYTPTALGIDNFERVREKTKQNFREIDDKFKQKMRDFTSEDSKNMVFTEDLKNMVYLANDSDEDLSLLETMIIKFNHQNQELRFGSFVFGPVVMRTYYLLNKPVEALKIFKNPQLDGFFDQVMSYQILMDLLFNNDMFDEVMEVYDVIKKRQLMGTKFHRHPTVLVFAACYKKNTPEAFEYVKKVWSEMQEVGHQPICKAVTFAAGLAINQNAPHVAIEILTATDRQNYVTVRNLKVAALADIDRPEDAFPILRRVLELDIPVERKQTFSEEAIEKLRLSVQRSGNKDLETEFNRIDQQLTIQGHIAPEPLASQLCAPMNYDPAQASGRKQDKRLAASFGINRPQRDFRKREGLQDLG